jgi:hypothetical protein
VHRGEWRHPDYLGWWWRTQVSPDTRIVAAVVAVALLGIGGYVAANGLEASVGSEADGSQVEYVTTTVQQLVTVPEGGPVAREPARVIARQAGGGVVTNEVTQVRVETVAGPVQTRVVTERDVVPVVRPERVTVPGRVRTIVQQAPSETVTRTVEREVERVVERVVTEERVVTVSATRTVVETVVVTVTPPPVTITAGPITLTVTVPRPIPPRP